MDRPGEVLPIVLLVYTDALPPILLIIELEGGQIGCPDELRGGIVW